MSDKPTIAEVEQFMQSEPIAQESSGLVQFLQNDFSKTSLGGKNSEASTPSELLFHPPALEGLYETLFQSSPRTTGEENDNGHRSGGERTPQLPLTNEESRNGRGSDGERNPPIAERPSVPRDEFGQEIPPEQLAQERKDKELAETKSQPALDALEKGDISKLFEIGADLKGNEAVTFSPKSGRLRSDCLQLTANVRNLSS